MPFNLKKVKQALTSLKNRPSQSKKSGFPIPPEKLILQIGLKGNEWAALVVTREVDGHAAFIVEPLKL